MLTTQDIKTILPDICQRYGIKYVEIFGSIARGEKKPDVDIDLIIEFEEPKDHMISIRFFGFLHELEDRFGCKVDLLTPGSIKNPYFMKTINKDKIRIYG